MKRLIKQLAVCAQSFVLCYAVSKNRGFDRIELFLLFRAIFKISEFSFFQKGTYHVFFTWLVLIIQLLPICLQPVQPTELILKECTTPRHDYFSAEFLVPFKYVGRHNLKITSGITDEHGIEWETGPSYLVHVDAQEHGGHYARKK